MSADAGYISAEKRKPRRRRKSHGAARCESVKAMREGELKRATKQLEYSKAGVLSKVEHPFRDVKRQFGYQRISFERLAKSTTQMLIVFALGNPSMMRRTLLIPAGEMRARSGGISQPSAKSACDSYETCS